MSGETIPGQVREPSRLDRRLRTGDAVVIGLGAMIGAGIFSAVAPACAAAGEGLLVALAIAAVVATLNALSMAQLAAAHPESGGAYVYGGRRLGAFWGFLAGWGFVIGKMASCAAMAMTVGLHLLPDHAHALAAATVLALTAVNAFGVDRTALATRIILGLVLCALATVVVAALRGDDLDAGRLWPGAGALSPGGVLQAAGLLFFAFAGYARVATLGEEVVDPRRAIPRAILAALGIALAVYLVVLGTALASVGAPALAAAEAPLVLVVEAGGMGAWAGVVRLGAGIASLGVLLSLLAGIGRTVFAMAANRDLPGSLAVVHPRHRVPRRAGALVGGAVAIAAALVDLRSAIGFSSFAILVYYAIANAACWTLPAGQRRWPRWLAAAGLLGCATVAACLPRESVLAGAGLLLVGSLVHALRRLRRA